jgi:hypothetical protein
MEGVGKRPEGENAEDVGVVRTIDVDVFFAGLVLGFAGLVVGFAKVVKMKY